MSVETIIDSVAHGGEGICRIDGRVCFVPYGLPGDRVRIALGEVKRGVLRGAIEEVVEASPHRTVPPCAVFGQCGGCTWLHFAYPAQGEWKRRIVSDAFERIGKLKVDVAWRESPEWRLGYRTRATFQGGMGLWGFHERGSRIVVDIQSCPLCHPRLNEALTKLRTLPLKGSVEIVVNPEEDDTLVWTKEHAKELAKVFPVVETPQHETRSAFECDGIPIVNGAFSQSSLVLNRLLHSEVYGALGGGKGPLLDLYCGNGNLSLKFPGEVTGLDHQRFAISAAGEKRPGCYDVADERGFVQALKSRKWDTIVLDPPRAGAKAIAPALAITKARQLIYVSCDPATLARDAAVLVKGGWRITQVTALDLFPNTPHVETVCHFAKS